LYAESYPATFVIPLLSISVSHRGRSGGPNPPHGVAQHMRVRTARPIRPAPCSGWSRWPRSMAAAGHLLARTRQL